MDIYRIIYVVLSVCSFASCDNVSSEEAESSEDTDLERLNSIVTGYEKSVNISKILEADDKRLLAQWTDDFQIRRLDAAMKYRLQMIRHHEHSLKNNGNVKWMECLHIHRRDIRQSTRYYHESERDCLRAAITRDDNNKEHVKGYEKQIKKWRKGYKYLVKLCKTENPTDEANSKLCLIEYMQNDKFDEVIHRLIHLKQLSVADLFEYYNQTIIELTECLKSSLSQYLEKIRTVMENLDKCYRIKNAS